MMTAEAVSGGFSKPSLPNPFRRTMMPVVHENTPNKPHRVVFDALKTPAEHVIQSTKHAEQMLVKIPSPQSLALGLVGKQRVRLARTSELLYPVAFEEHDILHPIKSMGLIKFWTSSCSCILQFLSQGLHLVCD